jgi:hypothetical protein
VRRLSLANRVGSISDVCFVDRAIEILRQPTSASRAWKSTIGAESSYRSDQNRICWKVLSMSYDIKVLTDPKKVSALLIAPEFIQLVGAVRRRDKAMVKLLSSTIEHRGYSMEEICAALERVK